MKIAQNTRNSGLGKVEVHATKPIVRVTLKPETEGEEPKVFKLEKENCPEYVQSGVFLVDLSSDGKKLYGMRPQMGLFKMKVKEFQAQKDKEPSPKTRHSQNGEYTYQTFTISFVIVDGEYTGMVVPGTYSYNFREGKDEVPGKGVQSVVEVSYPKSKYTAQLVGLLTVTGIFNKQIPWKENILPLLQKMMLKEDKVFSAAVKKGWVDDVFEEVNESNF